MAKRFTDTTKWAKVWFQGLEPQWKIFWFYLLDSCDHAGIWEVNWSLASFMVGFQLKPDEAKESMRKQIVELDNGKRWFIADFIEFQYTELNPANRAHNSVIKLLKKYGAYKGLNRGLLARKDKDTDKDMVKDKVTLEKKREIQADLLWQVWTKLIQDDKSKASSIKNASKLLNPPDPITWQDLLGAVCAYAGSIDEPDEYTYKCSNFFGQKAYWENWREDAPEEMVKAFQEALDKKTKDLENEQV